MVGAPSPGHVKRQATRFSFRKSALHEKKSLIDDLPQKKEKALSFEELTKADNKRKRVLSLARNVSAVSTVARLDMLPRSVIPRLLQRWTTWLVICAYAASSTLARWGRWDVTTMEVDLTAFDGNTNMVSFMIIFYVGYCYNRYTRQFEDTELAMRSIITTCTLARTLFSDPADVHKLWRYLNLAHLAAYCGLTQGYNDDNFFFPIAEKFGLFGNSLEKEVEEHYMKQVNIDDEGLRVVSDYICWSLDVIDEQVGVAKRFSPPNHANLNNHVVLVGDCVKRLYAHAYQILPFIYTHLVSLSCTIFLACNAFIKGLYFQPEVSYTFGLWLPCLNITITTLTIFGLLEVGDTILDPMGTDPEDFAIVHLVEWTIQASYDATRPAKRASDSKSRPANNPTRGAFGDNSELRAAATLSKAVLRWRKRFLRKAREAKALAKAGLPLAGGAAHAPHDPERCSVSTFANAAAAGDVSRAAASDAPRAANVSFTSDSSTGARPICNGRSDAASEHNGSPIEKNHTKIYGALADGSEPEAHLLATVNGDNLVGADSSIKRRRRTHRSSKGFDSRSRVTPEQHSVVHPGRSHSRAPLPEHLEA